MPKLIAYNARGWRIGEDHPRAKYTDHEVAQVLELRAAGMTYRAIARLMEIPAPTVRAWCAGLCRSEAPDHFGRLISPTVPQKVRGKRGG